jgi:hypothetical protein
VTTMPRKASQNQTGVPNQSIVKNSMKYSLFYLISRTTRTKIRVVAKFQILDYVKTQWPTQRSFCMTLKPVLDYKFKPLQPLNAENVWPTPGDFGAQFAVNLLVILHQSKRRKCHSSSSLNIV